MMLNLAILVYIILLAYWLGLEGLFSSMMHLGVVIVAGALAFAFWEPISIGMLSGMMPRFASAVGLVMPFVLFLFLFRLAADKFVRSNLEFGNMTNLIGGGALGIFSALLSAGIFMIAISRLPASEEIMGIKPYKITEAGEPILDPEGGKLWIGVDSMAAGFFSSLSGGSFYPANDMPMSKVRPNLVLAGHYNRLRRDPNSSTVASPEAVKISAYHVHNTPVEGLPQVFVDNLPKYGKPSISDQIADDQHKLVVIDTEWNNAADSMVYDGGVALRVYPTQMLLIAYDGSGRPTIHTPIAFSRIGNHTTKEREFTPVSDFKVVAKELGSANYWFAWMYLLPKDKTERYLYIRDRRFELENVEAKNKPEQQKAELVTALIGPRIFTPKTAVATGDPDNPGNGTGTPTVSTKQGGRSNVKAEDIQLTAALPKNMSKNNAPSLSFTDKNEVRSGEADVTPSGPISRALLVTSIETPAGNGVVRVKLQTDLAQSLLGQSVAAAGALNMLFLRDNIGSEIPPIAYVWAQASGPMHIYVEPSRPINAVTLLPYRKMGAGDELYVYFYVKKGARVLSINVGSLHKQDVDNLEVPKD
ncbi:MAG: hypothetical protein WD768_10530 [Phycisphaeraceae bacterium]